MDMSKNRMNDPPPHIYVRCIAHIPAILIST